MLPEFEEAFGAFDLLPITQVAALRSQETRRQLGFRLLVHQIFHPNLKRRDVVSRSIDFDLVSLHDSV